MNDNVFVEFIAIGDDIYRLIEKVESLGDEFIPIDKKYGTNSHLSIGEYYRIAGKITAHTASTIKLQDQFLSERMRISYISNDSKNRYRS